MTKASNPMTLRQPAIFRVFLFACLVLSGCGRPTPQGTLPARLVVDFSGGHVTLRGALPQAGARDRVLERARQQYGPGNVLDRIEISDKVIEAPWVSTDALLLAVVESGISDGQAVFDGQRLQLTGQVPTETIRAQISTRAARAAGSNIAVDSHLQVSH
ncbi:MAG: BON domain-containing protein [Proteobacteria bacterium]|nr:BON domain-containing protein [Pseudomonadota bacterium]